MSEPDAMKEGEIVISEPGVIEETVTDLARIAAPYNRHVLLQDVAHDSGMRILRLRIREGRRFTILDIDAETARLWGGAMVDWAAGQDSAEGDAS